MTKQRFSNTHAHGGCSRTGRISRSDAGHPHVDGSPAPSDQGPLRGTASEPANTGITHWWDYKVENFQKISSLPLKRQRGSEREHVPCSNHTQDIRSMKYFQLRVKNQPCHGRYELAWSSGIVLVPGRTEMGRGTEQMFRMK